MFEHIVLRHSEAGTPISAGQIAQALLFYQRVHAIIDRNSLIALIKQIGVDTLLALLARPDFGAVYTEEQLATITRDAGILKVHSYGAFSFTGDATAGTRHTVPERLELDLHRLGITGRRARDFSRRFLKHVPVRKLTGNHFRHGGLVEAAKQDLRDPDYVRAAVRRVLSLIPGADDPGDSLKFDVHETDLGTYVFDNIDFEAINQRRAQLSPALDPITVAHVLSHLQDARADLELAAFYGGDFVTSAITSDVIQARHEALLRRTQLNLFAQREFFQVTIPDMPTLAEAIDSGSRSFQEFIRLYERSAKFKQWLSSVNPDEGLIRDYLQSVSTQDWIRTPEAKLLRYVVTGGIALADPTVGIAAGLMDKFFVDKLFRGWRPNHFVDERLLPFVGKR